MEYKVQKCEDPDCPCYGQELVDRGYGYPVCPSTRENIGQLVDYPIYIETDVEGKSSDELMATAIKYLDADLAATAVKMKEKNWTALKRYDELEFRMKDKDGNEFDFFVYEE